MEVKTIEKINKLGIILAVAGFLIFIVTIIYMVLTSNNGVTSGDNAFMGIIGVLLGFIMFIVGGIISNFIKVPDKEKVLNECVDEIVKIYSHNPQGFVMRSPESQPLRDIGQKLADAGGKDLMLQAHKKATMRGVNGRNLEACWDGIGGWAG